MSNHVIFIESVAIKQIKAGALYETNNITFIGFKFRKWLHISIWPIDKTLRGTTNPGKCWPGSNNNEGVPYIPQWSRTGASPSNDLVSYLVLELVRIYPSGDKAVLFLRSPALSFEIFSSYTIHLYIFVFGIIFTFNLVKVIFMHNVKSRSIYRISGKSTNKSGCSIWNNQHAGFCWFGRWSDRLVV